MIYSQSDHSDFFSKSGINERYVTLTAEPGNSFEQEWECLMSRYKSLIPSTYQVAFLRIHLSDITRQAPCLAKWKESYPAFVSLIGQAPANGARVALEAWLLEAPTAPIYEQDNDMEVSKLPLAHYSLLLSRCTRLQCQGSYEQTQEEFHRLIALMDKEHASLKENVHRTWLYCRDIDNNYAGLVQARKEIFHKHQLTHHTHYITSTGIEGQSEEPSRLIAMDSFAVLGIQPEQVEHMAALDHLSSTHDYGVTFERGTRLIYGDRSTYYISGTASIDHHGEVVHVGNVTKQTERTIENIAALLAHYNARLSDLKQAVVYLRDLADAPLVAEIIAASEIKNVPYLMVKAPVCRPTWLVEIEAIGVNNAGNGKFADFR